LHGYAPHSPFDQPVCHLLQILREALKATHWLFVQFRIDRHPMLTATNVDAGRMGVHDIQSLPIYFGLVRSAGIVILNSFPHSYSNRSYRFARPGSDKVETFQRGQACGTYAASRHQCKGSEENRSHARARVWNTSV
jgi:hypothetical protein